MGNCYNGLKDYIQAVDAYKKALELDPELKENSELMTKYEYSLSQLS